jgi:hypothetical protein
MRHPLSSDSHAASRLPRSRSLAGKPERVIDDLFGTRHGETHSRATADPAHHATYAIVSREVAAVRIGVGRGARHEVILRSGVRLAVTYAQATHLADKIWDGLWPGEGKRKRRTPSTPRTRTRSRPVTVGDGSKSRSTSTSKSKNFKRKEHAHEH